MAATSTGKKSMNLTTGSIVKLIIMFAIPIYVGQVFQNLYNSVDSIVVGNFVGTTALAAVSASSDISMLLTGFFTGLSTGAGVLFSRYFGAGDHKKLHDSIHTALTFALLIGVVMAGLGILLTPQLLAIVKCPDDVWAEASLYLRIYLVGILFTSIYNVGAGVLRAVGDSRDPFIYLVIASCTNIVLDLLFVAVLKMGVSGVACATIISQGLSVFLVFRNLMTSDDVYRVHIRDMKMDKKILLEVIDLGIPAAIQACLVSVSNMFVQRYLNSFGSAAMAGSGAAKKIDRFAGMASQSIGLASTTFVSQNVGAQRLDRAFKGVRTCLGMALVLIAVIGTPIFFFAGTFVRIFTQDAEAVEYGVLLTKVMMPFYFLSACNQVFAGSVRGFGKSRAVMVLSLVGMIGLRQLFLFITMNYISWDIRFVYAGFPVGWFFASGLVFLYYWFRIRLPYNRGTLETVKK